MFFLGGLELPTMSDKEKINRFFSTALPCERTEDINEAVGNYSPNDEKRICKFQDKCRKKNCKFEHVPLTTGTFVFSCFVILWLT